MQRLTSSPAATSEALGIVKRGRSGRRLSERDQHPHKRCKWLVRAADPCARKGSPTILSDFHHQLHCCERSLRSRFTVREEGKVSWLESPNQLDATAESQVHEKSSMKILRFLPNSEAVLESHQVRRHLLTERILSAARLADSQVGPPGACSVRLGFGGSVSAFGVCSAGYSIPPPLRVCVFFL